MQVFITRREKQRGKKAHRLMLTYRIFTITPRTKNPEGPILIVPGNAAVFTSDIIAAIGTLVNLGFWAMPVSWNL